MAIVEDREHDRVAAAPSRAAGRAWAGVGVGIPGVVAVAAVAAVATVLGGLAPVVGAPVIAILIGIAVTLVRRPSERLRPGVAFSARRVLQASVVLLGTGLSLGQVLSTGVRSLPVLVGTLVAALVVARIAGRALGVSRDARALVGIGTAICGASAIAAADAVIEADEGDVSYAIATIFTFNVVAVLLYPSLGHLFGFSQQSFGLWAGTAINDLSSVVAASTIYGHTAASYGVIVKLTRTLAIIPITIGLAALRARRARPTEIGAEPTGARRPVLRRVLPTFIVLFVVAPATNTAGLISPGWHHPLSDLSTWMITAALAGIGLSTNVGHIRRAGLRPLALGGILWLTVGVTSIALQAATGTL